MVAVLFIAFGISEVFTGLLVNGIWLAFIGWFILQAASATYFQTQAGSLLRNVRVRDLMSADCHLVSPITPLWDLAQQALSGTRCFLVVDDQRFVGLVTPAEIRLVDPSRWQQTAVREVMRPAGDLFRLAGYAGATSTGFNGASQR